MNYFLNNAQLLLIAHCRWISSYQEERIGNTLTGLTPPYLCAWVRGTWWMFVLLILIESLTIND